MTVSGKELSYLKRYMRYTENFKKGMVRLIVAKGMTYKQLSDMIQIPAGTLSLWDKEYRQQIINEKLQEERKMKEEQEEEEKKIKWRRYGSGAEYYE